MLTLMFVVGVVLAVGLAVGMLALMLKLVLLPIKLAFGFVKLAAACTVGLVMLLLGLPLFLVLGLPLLVVWAMARLVFAQEQVRETDGSEGCAGARWQGRGAERPPAEQKAMLRTFSEF